MVTAFMPIVCVAICAMLVQSSAQTGTLQKPGLSSKIFLINNTELHSYTYSCPANQLIGLSADRKSLLFYDVEKQSPNRASVDLPLPGGIFTVSADGKQVAVTHDSYISIILNHGNMHSIKTFPISVIEASSIMIIEEFVCLIPAFDQWTYIQCLNVDSGATCTCTNQVYAGGLGFTNVAKNWIYMVDQELSPPSIYRYTLPQQSNTKALCLEYIDQNSALEDYDYGQHLWFSYDGTRIFLQNGLTLTSSDDNKLDMEPHGDFNSSYEIYQYSYFSQSFKYPNVIAGIRSDTNNTIYYYSWPYLTPIYSKTTPIPAPPQGKVKGAEEVHICDESDTTYAVVKYAFSDGTTKIGIVTLS